jgi:8-amino-7-oxononanoate synthase
MNDAYLAAQLAERKAQGYFRQRTCIEYEQDGIIAVNGKHYLNFASNDYLGLRQHEGVMQAWVEGMAQYGAGSGASPLVTGYSYAHKALEDSLADKLNREAVLLFNSGFAANQALCQALSQPDLGLYVDRLMHASFIDAARLSPAKMRRFRHNDMQHLAHLLHKDKPASGLLVSEGVFSMDGDSADIAGLVQQADTYSLSLLLDEAHSFGVMGNSGMGMTEQAKLSQQQCPIVMGTFGKAIGTAGAFVAGSQILIDYLVNFARHYVYSTAFPPAQAVATLVALELVNKGEQRARLHGNIGLFKQLAKAAELPILDSQSAIQPLVLGDPNRVLAASNKLASLGLWVPAIRYPTVPKHSDRLRITLSAKHSEQDITVLVDGLCLALKDD